MNSSSRAGLQARLCLPGLGARDSGLASSRGRIPHPCRGSASRIPNRTCIPNPEPRPPDPESRTPNPESRKQPPLVRFPRDVVAAAADKEIEVGPLVGLLHVLYVQPRV